MLAGRFAGKWCSSDIQDRGRALARHAPGPGSGAVRARPPLAHSDRGWRAPSPVPAPLEAARTTTSAASSSLLGSPRTTCTAGPLGVTSALAHSGMFPCFFGGSDSRLFRSSRSALMTYARVCDGAMTAST